MLHPGYATGHQWYAMFLYEQDDVDKALVEIQKAEELDPLSLIIKVASAWIYAHAGLFDISEDKCRNVLEMDSDFIYAHNAFSQIYALQGFKEKAIEERLKGGLNYRYSKQDMSSLNKAYLKNGVKGFWKELLKLVTKLSEQRYVSAFSVAIIYANLEETDKAFEWLEKAYTERDPDLRDLLVECEFSHLRSNLRFQAILKKMGLA